VAPDVHQAVQRVLLLLDAQFVARRAGRALAAAKAPAVIKNHRSMAESSLAEVIKPTVHAGAAKHRFDDFAVRVVRR